VNNRGFTTAEHLHHTIRANHAATVQGPQCPNCERQVRSERLAKTFPGCVGLRCRACGWEGAPVSTLNAAGQLVRADAHGQPTGEVLLDLPHRMGLVEMTPHEAIERAG
jgi:hypothetical protein